MYKYSSIILFIIVHYCSLATNLYKHSLRIFEFLYENTFAVFYLLNKFFTSQSHRYLLFIDTGFYIFFPLMLLQLSGEVLAVIIYIPTLLLWPNIITWWKISLINGVIWGKLCSLVQGGIGFPSLWITAVLHYILIN